MIKRFVETGYTDMKEWSAGPWVRYSDYVKIEKERDNALALAKERADFINHWRLDGGADGG